MDGHQCTCRDVAAFHFGLNVASDAVQSLRNGVGDGGQGVGIPAKRNGVSDRVLEAVGLQVAGDGPVSTGPPQYRPQFYPTV